jgi:hypothetical protein
MGTTLTGTTPQDTYDSLIKVTDNGPLTGSLKLLTDGLGNNSALSLSTAAASVTGTLAVTTGTNLATSSGSVGIGLSSPTTKLEIQDGASGAAVKVSNSGGGSAQLAVSSNATSVATLSFTNSLNLTGGNVGIGTSTPNFASAGRTVLDVNGTSNTMICLSIGGTAKSYFYQSAADLNISNEASGSIINFTSGSERMRISSDGYMRMAASTGGIQFNGDTAAANALDDYEEGTWTMGVSFGGASVGVTYSNNTGTYTKIGRQVTVNGYLLLANKGSSTGNALLTGLPFAVGNTIPNFSAISLWFNNITFTNQFQGYANYNTTSILLQEITVLGSNSSLTNVDFANNSEIIFSLTYFV